MDWTNDSTNVQSDQHYGPSWKENTKDWGSRWNKTPGVPKVVSKLWREASSTSSQQSNRLEGSSSSPESYIVDIGRNTLSSQCMNDTRQPGEAALLCDTQPKLPCAGVSTDFDKSSTAPVLENTEWCRDSRVHSIRELAPGTILWALHISETSDCPGADTQAAGRRGPSNHLKLGSRAICVKRRLMIVVKTFCTHYLTVGIFTNSRNGIQSVPEYDRKYYLPILDHRSDKVHQQQHGHLPMLETEEMDPRSPFIAPVAVVFFAGPVTMWARHPIEIVGRLTAHSTATLLQHYYREGEKYYNLSPHVIEELGEEAQKAKARQETEKERKRWNADGQPDASTLWSQKQGPSAGRWAPKRSCSTRTTSKREVVEGSPEQGLNTGRWAPKRSRSTRTISKREVEGSSRW